MTGRALQLLTLTLVWAALWSDLDLASVLSGVAAATLVLLLVPPLTFGRLGRPRALRLLRHTGATAWRLVVANAAVAREALTPGNGIHEAIVAVPIGDVGEEIATVISASISLAPGTVAVGVRPGVLYVHVLHAADLEETRRSLTREVDSVKRIFTDTEPRA